MNKLQCVLIGFMGTCLVVGCSQPAPTVTVTKRVVQRPIDDTGHAKIATEIKTVSEVETQNTNQVDAVASQDATATKEDDKAPSDITQLMAASTDIPDEPRDARTMAGPHPIAVIEDHVHEFGNMEPHQKREHTFVIRNDGTAPLKIRAGESSCKCTIGKVGSEIVRPGGESTILLSWHTTTETKLFAHEAEILTNDPNHPVLVCRVQGTVLQRIETSPETFSFSGVSPGTDSEMSVDITTQVWNGFDLTDITSNMAGLVHNLARLSDQEKLDRGVKDGYRLTVKLPVDLEKGEFAGTVRMRIVPEGEPHGEIFEIPVSGRVLRRVSVYGKGINSYGIMQLGRVPVGKGIKKSFIVKVRDPNS